MGVFGFNPLPARRPGATLLIRLLPRFHLVSILSQPEGRELLDAAGTNLRLKPFQSSPSPKAGSYLEKW